jgi:hypothetical protein
MTLSEKCNSTSSSAIQVKNRRKTIGIEEKLEKRERIVDICCNVRLAHSCTCTICEKADRITERAKCLDKIKANNMKHGVFVQQDYNSPIGKNYNKHYGCESFTLLLEQE